MFQYQVVSVDESMSGEGLFEGKYIMAMGKMDRFTIHARQIFEYAEAEAKAQQQDEVGTEFLLLALFLSYQLQVMLSGWIGVDVKIIREKVKQVAHPKSESVVSVKGLSSDVKQVIRFALQEMNETQHSHVYPEHILLAMTHLPNCTAMTIFADLSIAVGEIRRQTVRMLEERKDLLDGANRSWRLPGKSYTDKQEIRLVISETATDSVTSEFKLTVRDLNRIIDQIFWVLSEQKMRGTLFRHEFGAYCLRFSIEDTKP